MLNIFNDNDSSIPLIVCAYVCSSYKKVAKKIATLSQGEFKEIRDSLWIQIGCYQSIRIIGKDSINYS